MIDRIILGSGGHSQSLLSVMAGNNTETKNTAYIADQCSAFAGFRNMKHFYNILDVQAKGPGIRFVNGVGLSVPLSDRQKIFDEAVSLQYSPESVISKHALIDAGVVILSGCQVFPGAIIRVSSKIGENAVVNTGAIIEHDVIIGKGSFIAPGAILLGGCEIGEGVLVGAGAVVHPGVRIGSGAIIGSAALVRHDVADGAIFFSKSKS